MGEIRGKRKETRKRDVLLMIKRKKKSMNYLEGLKSAQTMPKLVIFKKFWMCLALP